MSLLDAVSTAYNCIFAWWISLVNSGKGDPWECSRLIEYCNSYIGHFDIWIYFAPLNSTLNNIVSTNKSKLVDQWGIKKSNFVFWHFKIPNILVNNKQQQFVSVRILMHHSILWSTQLKTPPHTVHPKIGKLRHPQQGSWFPALYQNPAG